MAKFTKENANWALILKDVTVLAMDISMRCNAGICGEHYINFVKLERYTNRMTYDVAEDADLLELAVPTYLRAKIDKYTTPQNVKVIIANYEAGAKTSSKRVSLVLAISGLCTGIAAKDDALKTIFVNKLILMATNLNIEVTLPPNDKRAEFLPRVY